MADIISKEKRNKQQLNEPSSTRDIHFENDYSSVKSTKNADGAGAIHQSSLHSQSQVLSPQYSKIKKKRPG